MSYYAQHCSGYTRTLRQRAYAVLGPCRFSERKKMFGAYEFSCITRTNCGQLYLHELHTIFPSLCTLHNSIDDLDTYLNNTPAHIYLPITYTA